MAAMKVRGGQMVPATEQVRNSPEVIRFNSLLAGIAAALGRAGSEHANLKRMASRSPDLMQQLRQVELNLDTALGNIEAAQRAMGKPA